MKAPLLLAVLLVSGAASGAQAFVVDCQWTYNLAPSGGAFAPVPSTGLDVDPSATSSVRLRLGFRVTDGSPSDAGGGFIGWNFGTLVSAGECCDSMSRTPGRLGPFTFLSGPDSNGAPSADPVPCGTMLTGIDATLGFQSPFWGCDPDGNPMPQPPPTIRGLFPQAFAPVFEITLALRAGLGTASITAGGNLIVASQWNVIGTPIPPDCGDPSDPSDDLPGSVIYAPATHDPVPFTCVATVNCVPAPGATIVLSACGLLCLRRRSR